MISFFQLLNRKLKSRIHFWTSAVAAYPAIWPTLAIAWHRLSKIVWLGNRQLDYLAAAQKELAPFMNFAEFCWGVRCTRDLNYTIKYRRYSPTRFQKWMKRSTELQMRCGSFPNAFDVTLAGQQNVEAALRQGRGVMLIAWHNGAWTHNFLRDLYEWLPNLQVFSAFREMYCFDGKLFYTTPLMENPTIGFLRMSKCLEMKKPILMHFDGISGKRDLICTVFNTPMYFSRGFIHLARMLKPAVIPATATFFDNKIRAILGPDLFAKTNLDVMTDEEVIDKTLNYFIEHLKSTDPTQLGVDFHFSKITKPVLHNSAWIRRSSRSIFMFRNQHVGS